LIDPIPIHIIKNPIFTLFHGVQFSSDSKYIACTTIEKLGLIYIYRIEKNTDGSLHLAPTQIVQNRYPPSKPKSLHFSRDNSLMIICYSPNADSKTSLQSYGELAIHTFDNVSGTISQQPVYELIGTPELCNPDDVAFSNDDLSSLIIVPCQGNDTIVFYSFDKINHKIDPNFFSFTNPHSQISFPHGLSLTLNNKYLALSNYGDDKVTIYSLNKVSPY
jgi:6-phosphogluconolactonase (cycloisomerase 2 family)